MPITTCPNTTDLEQLFQGQPTEAAAERLERHVQECPACVAKLKELLKNKDTVSGSFAGMETLGDFASQPAVRELMRKLEAMNPAASVAEMPTAGFEKNSAAAPISGIEGEGEVEVEEPLGLEQIAHYKLIRKLGAGGMGMVFEALDTHLQRPVALKIMLPSLAKNPSSRKRFLQEARSAAAITHDHIVPIFQVGEDQGIPFLAMQLLEGMSLADLLKKQPILKPSQVIRLGVQIAEGLAAAHTRGLIHRDIKPGNVWIEPVQGGRVKILDFGLARLEKGTAQITQSGVIVGTPAYMAPEQARGEKNLDGRVDLFSLGCALYLMATGQMAFGGNDAVGVLMAVQMQEPPPPRQLNANVPQGLSDLIMQLLVKDPAGRPASAKDVVKMLRSLDRDPTTSQAALLSAQVGRVARPKSSKEVQAARGVQPRVSKTRGAPAAALVAKGVPPHRLQSQGAPPRFRRLAVAAVAAGFIALVAAGVVIYLRTPDGLVRIEINDPAIKLTIQQEDGVTLTGADQKTISVKPGKNGLIITRGPDFTFDTTTFTLKKGDKTTLKIDWLEGKGMVVRRDNETIGEKAAPAAPTVEAKPPPAVVPAPSRKGHAVRMTGSGVQLDTSSFSLKGRPAWTVEAWVTPYDAAPRDGEAALVLMVDPVWIAHRRGERWAMGGPTSRPGSTVWATGKPEAGKPVHLAMSRGPQGVSFFVNGVRENSEPLPIVFLAGQQWLRVCPMGSPKTRDVGFQGDIDELRVSTVERYQGNFTPRPRFETDGNTLALFHFDEGEGEVFKDSSGNNHHGKLVGAQWVKRAEREVSAARSAAAWTLANGGTVDGTANGVYFDARKPADLPAQDPLELRIMGLADMPAVTDEKLREFAALPGLAELHAYGCKNVTDEGIKHLRTSKLRLLLVGNTSVTKASLPILADITTLTDLGIDNNFAVSEAELLVLARLTKLKWLRLSHLKVSREAVQRLHASLPQCQIETPDLQVLKPVSNSGNSLSPSRYKNILGMEFALVPKGKAWLGGMSGTLGSQEAEVPYDFYLGIYEVTQEEWRQVMGVNPSHFTRSGKASDAVKDFTDADLARFPVDNVSWDDCQEFIARLNEKTKETGWVYRLPTEKEWQYACRGGSLPNKEDYAFDFYLDRPTNTLLPDKANFDKHLKRPQKVGSYAANRLGLFDMHGNMGEWCDDLVKDQKGGPGRPTRGGGWGHEVNWCRAVFRVTCPQYGRFGDIGLRLARVPVAKQGP